MTTLKPQQLLTGIIKRVKQNCQGKFKIKTFSVIKIDENYIHAFGFLELAEISNFSLLKPTSIPENVFFFVKPEDVIATDYHNYFFN